MEKGMTPERLQKMKEIERLKTNWAAYREFQAELNNDMKVSNVDTKVSRLEQELADTRAELQLQKELLAAMKHTVVATIGGVDYEGYPTCELNYLQRLRILVEKEKQFFAVDRNREEWKAEAESARAELAELNSLFDLRHKADMRAIQRWRVGHPGRELRQPDHADMVVFLLDEIDAFQRNLKPVTPRLLRQFNELQAENERLKRLVGGEGNG